MMQSYLHTMAAYTGDTPDTGGRYSYRYFDAYWSPAGIAEGRIPYVIEADRAAAGFALINRHSPLDQTDVFNIAEFHVEDGWKRRGVGRRAFRHLLALHPGRWEIAVLRANAPALAFWITVASEMTGWRSSIITTGPATWDGSVIQLEPD